MSARGDEMAPSRICLHNFYQCNDSENMLDFPCKQLTLLNKSRMFCLLSIIYSHGSHQTNNISRQLLTSLTASSLSFVFNIFCHSSFVIILLLEYLLFSIHILLLKMIFSSPKKANYQT